MSCPCPIVLRALEREDLWRLAMVHSAAFARAAAWGDPPWDLDELNGLYTYNLSLAGWCLWSADQIIGFIIAQVIGGGGEATGETEIITFAVLPRWQGLGMGRRLLRHLMEHLPHPIFLEVAVHNGTALALYKRLGFTVLRRRTNYYSGMTDAFVMEMS